MKTLVTGATGLVGHAVVRSLLARDRPVRLLARTPEKARSLLPDCEVVAGDVTDRASLRAAVEGCNVVYHAAGLPEQWLPDPATFDRVNRDGTRHIVEAALEAKVERFVYTSTIDVFTSHRGQRYDESQIDPEPKGTAYQRSKQAADREVVRAQARGLYAVFLHPSAVYGPGPGGDAGVNGVVAKMQRGQLPAVPPGSMPVVYSDDVGEAHVRAEERAEPGARFILSERCVTTKQLGELVAAQLGVRPPPVLPLPLAQAASWITETVSRFTHSAPLMPAGQLRFLQHGARPDGDRARRELDIDYVELPEGVRRLIAERTGA